MGIIKIKILHSSFCEIKKKHNQGSLKKKKKNWKLCNLFIKNNVHLSSGDINNNRHSCNRIGCESILHFIGYTTCSIRVRFKMHTQNCMSIKK